MQLPLSLFLKPSQRLVVLLIAAHGALATSIVVLVTSTARVTITTLLLVLLFVVVLSLFWQLVRLFGPKRINHLILHKDGTIEYFCLDGSGGTARVDPRTTVTPWLTVLLLRTGSERRMIGLTVLSDALAENDFRCLRLWLRWLAVE